MNTTAAWAALWWWWLLAVLASFLVIEGISIAAREVCCGTAVMDWTLSDCIRRRAKAHHWMPALAVGFSALLLVHWFWQP